MLTVYGANFVSGAVVNWNRSPRKTTFVSTRELQAQILASDVRKPTAGFISVTNPRPGGGESSSSYAICEVHKPTHSLSLKMPHSYGSPHQGNIDVLVAADLLGEGKLDLIDGDSYGGDSGAVRTWIGRDNGTFHSGSIVSTNYFPLVGSGLAVGDFNNDGALDVVFSKGNVNNYPPTYAGVKLGNGKGGFKSGSQFGDFAVTTQFAVGDFNDDGKLDVAVGDTDNKRVSIFLGNGDGTFRHLADYGNLIPVEIIAADLNGDGNLDLAVDAGNIWVLIGNGDGTFQDPVEVASVSGICAFGPPMLVNDFNRDGKFDIAFCNGSGQIGVLLGDGDGTFQAPVYYDAGQKVDFTFTAGDFRSRGITDLIVSHDGFDFNFYAMYGNGDGTFQKEKQIQLPGGPDNGELGIVVGDFNSDGLLDFIFQRGGWGMAEYLQK